MKKFLGAVLILLLTASPSFGQQSVVEKYRKDYPTPMSAEQKVEMLKKVAAEANGGILKKDTGNNCLGYSCDIICFSNGNHFDVLQEEEGAAIPRWNFVGKIDPTRCEIISSKPLPDPELPDPKPTDEEVLNRMDAMIQLMVKQIELQEKQTTELKVAIEELKKQIALGIKIRW